jgi:hypothetical protein
VQIAAAGAATANYRRSRTPVRRVIQPPGARPSTAVKAMVCVHHAGSTHWARRWVGPATAKTPFYFAGA